MAATAGSDRDRAVSGDVVARDLAIDLGTANTLVYMKGRGIVLNEPSVIALNRQTGEVLATGREAWQMIGRTPGYIVAVRPLRGGAITDFEITERMIRLLLQRVGVSRFTRPKVVICVPSAITEVERRAVTDAARRAGAADANLIEQPMAAAIGADLPIDEPVGNMVIDIGGGTSETAVISLGGIVALEAVRVGSFDIDAAIQNYVRREHGIAIGERTAEEIKVAIGSADPTDDENQAEVRGRDLMTGLPKTVLLTPEEIRFAIEDVVSSIVASVIRCLAKAPPELSQDFLVRGMYLVGGGGLLRGLAQRIERETKVPVRLSNVPAGGRRARRRPRHRALRGTQGHVHGRPPLSGRACCRSVVMRPAPARRRRADAGPAEVAGRSMPAARIRDEFGVPAGFPPDVGWPPPGRRAAASARARRPHRRGRSSRSTPPASTDLDQAFALERSRRRHRAALRHRRRRVLRRPRAPAGQRGVAARRHGLPARRAGPAVPARRCRRARRACCPTAPARPSCSPCASTPTATPCSTASSGRSMHSRAKLAYDTVRPDDLPPEFAELARRIERAEERRDAPRVEFPEQELVRVDGRWALRFEPRLRERGPQRRHVAGDQPRRRRRAARRQAPACSA